MQAYARMTDAERDECQRDWIQFESIVIDLVRRSQRRQGGDFDDLLEQAQWAFIAAWQTWDPARGSLHDRVTYKVNHRLLDLKLNRIKKLKGNTELHIGELDVPARHEPSPLIDLSSDARTVVMLLTDHFEDIFPAIGRTCLMHRSFRSFMRQLGWSREKVDAAWHEIGEIYG